MDNSLPYLIDKQKFGTYVQLQFIGEGGCVGSFGLELEHNPNVLSYLTTLIDETDVSKQEKDLDTQIAGQSRESEKIYAHSENADKNNPLKDSKSAENNETSLVEAEVAESAEEPIKKSAGASGEEDHSAKEEVNDPSDTLQEEENQENADETSAVSEEE